MRLVGIDFGGRRIGVAVGESVPLATSARAPLNATGSLERDAKAIAEIVKKEMADGVVVGIPLNPLGSDRMERICRQLADRLMRAGMLVFTIDESLSTIESEVRLAGVSKRRKRIDGESARVILERHFGGLG